MADKIRIEKLNSLLQEVLSEVILKDVKNPHIHQLLTITNVAVSRDLHTAKVHFSVIGDKEEKDKTLKALQSAAGYIAVNAAKKVTMRYFPQLQFFIDDSVDKQMHIHNLIEKMQLDKKPTLIMDTLSDSSIL